MADTIQTIIKDCCREILSLDADSIQTEIRDLALAVVNDKGKVIFDSWPWDNSKIDEFTAPASDADGIITFGSTVDAVRAIRSIPSDPDSAAPIFAQDDVQAMIQGYDVNTERFTYLADSSTGCRRIRVDSVSASNAFKVLALKRFVTFQSLASTEAGYDATRDYTLVSFPIDRAEPALRAFVKDALRQYAGFPTTGDGPGLLAAAIRREENHQQKEHRVNPRVPMFEDVDNWWGR